MGRGRRAYKKAIRKSGEEGGNRQEERLSKNEEGLLLENKQSETTIVITPLPKIQNYITPDAKTKKRDRTTASNWFFNTYKLTCGSSNFLGT
jgi:hypothetical protein